MLCVDIVPIEDLTVRRQARPRRERRSEARLIIKTRVDRHTMPRDVKGMRPDTLDSGRDRLTGRAESCLGHVSGQSINILIPPTINIFMCGADSCLGIS